MINRRKAIWLLIFSGSFNGYWAGWAAWQARKELIAGANVSFVWWCIGAAISTAMALLCLRQLRRFQRVSAALKVFRDVQALILDECQCDVCQRVFARETRLGALGYEEQREFHGILAQGRMTAHDRKN